MAHHEDEARGSISELPDDNWIHWRTAAWDDSGLHTFREPHISVLPPRRRSMDGSDRKRNIRHQPGPCRCHGDRRKTKNHRCVNNRWQRKTLKLKSRDRTNTFKTEDQLNSSSKRTHWNQSTMVQNDVQCYIGSSEEKQSFLSFVIFPFWLFCF